MNVLAYLICAWVLGLFFSITFFFIAVAIYDISHKIRDISFYLGTLGSCGWTLILVFSLTRLAMIKGLLSAIFLSAIGIIMWLAIISVYDALHSTNQVK